VLRTTRLRLAAVWVATLALGSCLPGEPTDIPPQPSQASLLLRADLSTTAVATLVVEVTAPDIAPPLLFNIPIVAGAAVGTITLPAGSNRTIAIRAYDAGGVQTHRGSVTVNLQPGANPTIAIVLTPLTGDVPIEVTLGSFAVTVTPAVDSLLIGDTVSLTATILDANGNPVPGQVVWGVLSPRVASVVSTGTRTGRVTAIRPGRTTVVAAYGGTAGPAAVAVLGWFAAPSGSSDGDGSGRPWDLPTALQGGNGRVLPGDTVWLRGGTYTSATPVNSTLTGTALAPVVVRQYPGERAILDARGATSSTSRGDFFTVRGTYSTFWGFEVIDSDPVRTDTRPNLIVVTAAHVKLINLIVHDGGIGFYTFSEPVDIEITGCLAYNNGWQESVFGNGHGIYAKSTSGPVFLRDNILFNQFGYGLHIFTIAGPDGLSNIHAEGNVSFNNGAVTADPVNSPSANILFGGSVPVRNGTVIDNMTYFSPNVGVHNLLIGFATTVNQEITVRNNYAVGGRLLVEVGQWQSFTMTDNSLFGSTSDMIWLRDSTLSGFQLANNRYYRDPSAEAWGYINTDYGFAQWQQVAGVGATDRAVTSDPAEPKVFLRPNRYEPGRANLIIYNWSRQAAVPVDLSGIVRVGDRYEVRNVQDFFGAPAVSGTYGGGPVDVPMAGVTPVAPIGGSPTPPPHTGPDFGVFVVISARR
jgi:Big-like domain-containing protein